MQEVISIQDAKIVFQKMLAILPGKPQEILKDLELLLQGGNVQFAPERAALLKNFNKYLLRDNVLRQQAVKALNERINFIRNFLGLSSDLLGYTFSFLSLTELNPARLVSKKWQQAADLPSYWRKKLVEDLGISQALALEFKRPDIVYKRNTRIVNAKMKEAKRVVGEACALQCLDVKDLLTLQNYFGKQITDITQLNCIVDFCNLNLTFYLLEQKHFEFNQGTLYSIARAGSLPLVQHLIEKKQLQPDQNTIDMAARSGSMTLVKYLIEHQQLKPSVDTLFSAAESGSLLLMQYLIAYVKPNQNTIFTAARSGSVQLVQFLIDQCKLKLNQDVFNRAARSGSLELVRYLEHKSSSFIEETLNQAARSGSLPLVRYLIETKELKPNQTTLDRAARSGSLVLVKYLLQHKQLIPNQGTLHLAVQSASLPLFIYFIEKTKLIPDQDSLDNAANIGYLPLVEYLIKEKKLKPNQNTLEMATANPAPSVISYIREQLSTFDEMEERVMINPSA